MKRIFLNTMAVTGIRALRMYRKPLGRAERRKLFRGIAWVGWLLLPSGPRVSQTAYGVHFVANTNEGSLTMGTHTKSIQPSLVKQDARPSGKSADGAGYKLHLVLDKQSYARLVWLQGALRAASFGEVLRRALDAYELFDPEGLVEKQEGVDADRAISAASGADLEHLYIVISDEMKEQLEKEKSAHGRTYKTTIRRALCVLMQLVRERAILVAKVKKGDNDAKKHDSAVDNLPPALLASL